MGDVRSGLPRHAVPLVALVCAACAARTPPDPPVTHPRSRGAAVAPQRPPERLTGIVRSFASFGEFVYEASPAFGFDVGPGEPVRLRLTSVDGRLRYERTVLVAEGTAGARCLRLGRECTWVTDSTGFLSAEDARRVREGFAAVRILDGCSVVPSPQPCPPHQYCFQDDVIQSSELRRIDTFRWDDFEVRPNDECSSGSHLSFEEGTRLLRLLGGPGR